MVPWKNGKKPRYRCKNGSTVLPRNGANTKRPHSPKTTLGTAASNSMKKLIGRAIRTGANSARKIAAEIPTTPATTMAIAELTTVPKMNGRAPKWLVNGFHSELHRNLGPNATIDSHAPRTSSANRPTMIATKRSVAPSRAPRNARSAIAWPDDKLRGARLPARAAVRGESSSILMNERLHRGGIARAPRDAGFGARGASTVRDPASPGVLDLDFGEGLLSRFLDRLRERHVVETSRNFLSVTARYPRQDVFDHLGPVLIGRTLVDERPGVSGDRVRVVAAPIDDGEVRRRDVGLGRCRSLDGGLGAEQPLPGLVLELRRRHLVLDRIREFDVSDRTGRLADLTGDAVIALAADRVRARPLDALARADFVFPVLGHVAQEVGENVRRAGTVGAMDRHDWEVGQGRTRIQFLQNGIVPARDLPLINVDDGLTRQTQPAGDGRREVVRDRDSAQRNGDLHDGAARALEFIGVHRNVRRAEVDRFRSELLNAAATADRLVIDGHLGVRLAVRVKRLRGEWVDERGAGTRQLRRRDGGQNARSGRCENSCDEGRCRAAIDSCAHVPFA